MDPDENRENELKWKRHQKSVIRLLFFDEKSGSNHGSFLLVTHVMDVVHAPRLVDVVNVTNGDRAGSGFLSVLSFNLHL